MAIARFFSKALSPAKRVIRHEADEDHEERAQRLPLLGLGEADDIRRFGVKHPHFGVGQVVELAGFVLGRRLVVLGRNFLYSHVLGSPLALPWSGMVNFW